MKIKLFLFLLMFSVLNSDAQDHTHCSLANQSELSITPISKDIISFSGDVTFQFCLRTMNTSISIDTLIFSSEYSTFTNFSTTLSQGLYTGSDSVVYDISFQCDTNQLPFYPKEIQYTIVTSENTYHSQAMVYFTPWNSIKIMNSEDFNDPSIAWIFGNNDAQRTRSFISIDSFQVSYDSTLPTDYKTVKGSAMATNKITNNSIKKYEK